jgi:hypothetical protein
VRTLQTRSNQVDRRDYSCRTHSTLQTHSAYLRPSTLTQPLRKEGPKPTVTRRPEHVTLYQKSRVWCLRQSDSDSCKGQSLSSPRRGQRHCCRAAQCRATSDKHPLIPHYCQFILYREPGTNAQLKSIASARLSARRKVACLVAILPLFCCLRAKERHRLRHPACYRACLRHLLVVIPAATTHDFELATPWNCPLAELRHASPHIPGSVLPTSSVAIFQRIFQRARPVL